MSTVPVYDIPVNRITGEGVSLADYRGKVLLIVNVASKCGLTPQYDALEKIYSRFKESGFVVCGFPANDFGAQEPGSSEEIQAFCTTTFSVDFPMFQKIGDTRPGFRERLNGFLSSKHNSTTNPEPGILWNFEKFLIDRNGSVVARFSPEVLPDDPTVVAAIESALANQ
jgi:glutathione peroxidase